MCGAATATPGNGALSHGVRTSEVLEPQRPRKQTPTWDETERVAEAKAACMAQTLPKAVKRNKRGLLF